MGKSKISYLDWVFNAWTGCSGDDCLAHCYAMDSTRTFPAIHGKGIPFRKGMFHLDRLNQMSHLKKPRVIGVGFFGDLFDKQITDSQIHRILHSCELAPQHQYIFLTKQHKRMVDIILNHWWCEEGRFPNWWMGVTVCTQAEWNKKAGDFLKVPGKKWVSYEPAIGPLKFLKCELMDISLVVVGGESGPKARPMHPDWVRSVRDQCAAAGVPFYFKQWGEWVQDDFQTVLRSGATPKRLSVHVTTGETFDFAYTYNAVEMMRVGLKAAGRTLDGRTHDELPWRKA